LDPTSTSMVEFITGLSTTGCNRRMLVLFLSLFTCCVWGQLLCMCSQESSMAQQGPAGPAGRNKLQFNGAGGAAAPFPGAALYRSQHPCLAPSGTPQHDSSWTPHLTARAASHKRTESSIQRNGRIIKRPPLCHCIVYPRSRLAAPPFPPQKPSADIKQQLAAAQAAGTLSQFNLDLGFGGFLQEHQVAAGAEDCIDKETFFKSLGAGQCLWTVTQGQVVLHAMHSLACNNA
jgi:hypothetical protein